MNKTTIETIKNPDGTQGYSWNPISGCLYHNNGMCEGGNFPCYAYGLANTRLRERYLANMNIPSDTHITSDEEDFSNILKDPFYPRFWEDRLDDIPSIPIYKEYSLEVARRLQEQKRRGVFVCDMSDLFGIGIPEEWTNAVLGAIQIFWQHRFYLLTKQPQNLVKFSPFPDNCWVGVTICNQKMADYSIPLLLQVDAKVRYVSIEPFLEAIDLSAYGWLRGCNACCNGDRCDNPRHYFRPQCPVCKGTAKGRNINWIIIGSCTGTRAEMEALIQKYHDLTLMPFGKKWTAQPKIEWVQEIVEAADKTGVPVFLKNNLDKLMPKYRPDDKLIQEMPKLTLGTQNVNKGGCHG